MSQILNNIAFNKNIQRIVETKDGLILNGTYYNKSNMTPVAFSTLPTYGGCYDIAMNKRLILNSYSTCSCRTKNQGELIVVDQNDPNIQYVFTNGNRGESIQTVIKIKECNGKCEYISYNVLSNYPGSNGVLLQILGQDNDYIYLMFEYSALRPCFAQMNKNSLTFTVIKTYSSYYWANGIYEPESYIYIPNSYSGKNYINIFDKVKKTLFEYTSVNNSSNSFGLSLGYSDSIKIDENNFYFYGFKYTSDNKISVIKFEIDLSNTNFNEAIKETIIDITFTDTISSIPIFSSSYNIHYEPFITIANNKQLYFNIAVYELNTSTPANYPKYGIYTFGISNDGNLELKTFLNFGNIVFRGFLGMKDNNTIVGASDQSLFFGNFSSEKEGFVLSETKNVNPKCVGIDKENNIWYVNGSDEVELLNINSVNSLEMTFEKGNYTYDGADISTYIELSTKNMEGNLIECKLLLTIKGDATWNSNNAKTINVLTSIDGIIQVPLTIKNKGNIMIIPQIIM